jgi:hypothetical protein
MSGLDAAFLIASIAALAAAAVALLIKPNLAVMEVAEVLGVVEVADQAPAHSAGTFLEAAGDL